MQAGLILLVDSLRRHLTYRRGPAPQVGHVKFMSCCLEYANEFEINRLESEPSLN